MVGRARRALSCFVMTLSYSRALYLEFFFDQTTENFLARSRACLSSLERTAARDSLRQSQSRRAGAARQPDSVQPPPDRTERALPLRATALPGARRKSERARGAGHSLCARFLLGRPRPSPRWPNAIARLWLGAIRWRINGAGRATIRPHGRTKSSPKNSRGCCLRRFIPSTPTESRPCARTRPSMCASISTITPSRRKPSGAR